jgi:hypothetical protein
MNRSTALIINPSDSKCGACGRAADPHELAHLTELGYYSGPRREGCGVVWEYVDTDYMGGGIAQAAMRMRPDLRVLPGGFIEDGLSS